MSDVGLSAKLIYDQHPNKEGYKFQQTNVRVVGRTEKDKYGNFYVRQEDHDQMVVFALIGCDLHTREANTVALGR